MVSIKSIAVLFFAGLAVAAPAWEHPAGEPDRSMKGMCNQDQVVSCCNTGGLIAVPVGQCTGNLGNTCKSGDLYCCPRSNNSNNQFGLVNINELAVTGHCSPVTADAL